MILKYVMCTETKKLHTKCASPVWLTEISQKCVDNALRTPSVDKQRQEGQHNVERHKAGTSTNGGKLRDVYCVCLKVTSS